MRIQHFTRQGIIGSFGQWAVTQYGIDNLTGPVSYEIDKETLHDPHWSDHMAQKNWVNCEDFNSALAFAREHFHIKVDGHTQGYRPAA